MSLYSRASLRYSLAALSLVLLGALAGTPAIQAQTYTIGSSNTASADPPVTRPDTTPCIVNLFTLDEFDNYSNMPFTFTPPAACPGPWSKVVLTGDYYITPGIQYDRTSQIFFNGANIYFGTTPEPTSATVNDPWHFENDLTDYASMFTTTGSGYASLGNTVNSTYTGVIYGTANLYFYPVDAANPAVTPADVVIALPQGGGATIVNSSSPSFTTTLTLPTNMTRMYLDVVSQSQNEEEQWFYCLPNDIAGDFDDCGNTNFRETDVTIDGVPAGAAPVASWIYTGGLDPYLWFPITGNQTLNLKAYRIDLSPFAGALSDGNSHTIGVGVFDAFEYFTETASLLIYEDHGSTTTGGSVTSNTLTLPNPQDAEDLQTDQNGDEYGYVYTWSDRGYSIVGTVYTSSGTITNSVTGNLNFYNTTYLYAGELQYTQNVDSTYTAEQVSSSAGKTTVNRWSYPLNLQLTETEDPDTGNIVQVTSVTQSYNGTVLPTLGLFGGANNSQVDTNVVSSTDTLLIDYDPNYGYYIAGNQDQSSSQYYFQSNATGYCYAQDLAAANNALTSFNGLGGCADSPYSSDAARHVKALTKKKSAKVVPAAKLVGPLVRRTHSTEKKEVQPLTTRTSVAPAAANR